MSRFEDYLTTRKQFQKIGLELYPGCVISGYTGEGLVRHHLLGQRAFPMFKDWQPIAITIHSTFHHPKVNGGGHLTKTQSYELAQILGLDELVATCVRLCHNLNEQNKQCLVDLYELSRFHGIDRRRMCRFERYLNCE